MNLASLCLIYVWTNIPGKPVTWNLSLSYDSFSSMLFIVKHAGIQIQAFQIRLQFACAYLLLSL